MAQTAIMGPPLSPRETRRSGRRTAPSLSASTSNSPDSPAPEAAPTRPPQSTHRPSLTSSNSGSRNKRSKREDTADIVDEQQRYPNGTHPSSGNANGRAKRKSKDKDKPSVDIAIDPLPSKPDLPVANITMDLAEPDEQDGVTRCVCGSTGEDDPDAGEFMVQCETCNAWQHGLCMGFEAEEQLPEDDYHCEQCRPDLHVDLLKRLAKRARHSSTASHHTSTLAARASRSHSPNTLLKPAKRRNTMNSRDAAYDESLKEIMEATAAEAAALNQSSTSLNGSVNGHVEDEQPAVAVNGRKKRKRGEDDAESVKRIRSASTTSDQPRTTAAAREEIPPSAPNKSTMPAPPAKASSSRNRRGGRKSAVQAQDAGLAEGEEGGGATPHNRRANNSRAKGGTAAAKRGQAAGNAAHDHSTRRNNQSTPANGQGPSTHASAPSNSRAHHNSHAYVVSQQALYTSWNLPDYLLHLEHMLPSVVPRPLQVCGSGLHTNGRQALERVAERGAKVKWPAKRTSLTDMNKRVRALVEWVGREQANSLERGRRKEKLDASLREAGHADVVLSSEFGMGDVVGRVANGSTQMALDDGQQLATSPIQERLPSAPKRVPSGSEGESTMGMMEELMSELISFQERFGRG